MASTFNASPDQAVDLIAKGLRYEFEGLLRARLLAHAKEILEPTVKAAAENLVTRVQAYHRVDQLKTEVQVAFNTRLPLP